MVKAVAAVAGAFDSLRVRADLYSSPVVDDHWRRWVVKVHSNSREQNVRARSEISHTDRLLSDARLYIGFFKCGI